MSRVEYGEYGVVRLAIKVALTSKEMRRKER